MRYQRFLATFAALLIVRAVPMHAQAGAATDVIVGRVTDSRLSAAAPDTTPACSRV